MINLSATDGSDFQPTPEPGTFALLGLGLLSVGWAARRRKANA
ncbi:MAG: PEP-CTERM sorting domain-containing protein [Desulfococcaceae bacterium]